MIRTSNIVGIVADDLTGANDTALQFKLNGADTNILLDTEVINNNSDLSQAWAISTESRNVSLQDAFEKVKESTQLLVDKINPDFFYKKIDSTVRGNIAVEVLSMLEVLGWDSAVIMPAFPQEGRITVGGYHLLRGIPIERTEMARDPHSPITESHLPTLLKSQLGGNLENLVGEIDLKTIMDGAGPILMKLNELVEQGKKLIVADSVFTTDLEQIVLAMQKSNSKILPVGTAAAAKILSNQWFPQCQEEEILPVKLPKLPKLIVSGSATNITANQIDKLEQSDEYDENCLVIELNVLIHTSKLLNNFDGFSDTVNVDFTKSGLAALITDFLADLTKQVLAKKNAILITLGGETSYKCCNAINANQLKLVDEVLPAIALGRSVNSNQWIVTKSGNLGGVNTLIEILKYFEKHEE